MNIIIPLGGLGQRFIIENYNSPKPLVNVLGKPMIEHIIDNLVFYENDNIILVYNEFLENYNFSYNINHKYKKNNIYFIKLNKQTDGAVETILYSLNYITNHTPNLLENKFVLLDGDTIYNIDVLDLYRNKTNNAVVCFTDYLIRPIYSYINIDTETNNIIDIKEKQKISNIANTGCYCFENGIILKKYCEKILKNNIRMNNEYYTSCVISEMINDNYIFTPIIILQKDFDCIGTPIQLYKYVIKKQKYHTEKKRFCFDLDNTLVTSPLVNNDYTTVNPIKKNIMFLQFLKELGHTIIIYTARKMRTFNGNIGEVTKNIAKITIDTLEKFNIPYDELYFGKPYAHFYIDDLAVNAYDCLEKYCGFYYEYIKERSHNKITTIDDKYICKSSTKPNSLDGEVYYYINIPKSLLNYFPKLIDYNLHNNEYIIEKINGITLSYHFVNENLHQDLLLQILSTLKTIHITNTNINESNINIYSNYCKKLETRFNTYDYSIFENYLEIYNKIYNYFNEYENSSKGKYGIIHGDPVFSNIITDEENIKFIDMRGKIDDTLTIYGDIFYDYSKIYQSLIGYDEIILHKYVSNKYRTNLINVFNNFIIENYGVEYINIIEYITSSLLFTLIPIHNDSNIYKFYELSTKLLYK